ncbi:methionyl-tRNA formyltransferase, mitochondrial-like [Gigantopelta aegis]|uniref:methionyl-tRNA formyltransferase, mitochondrial-like n=1 Tax=Gigantopelta aegis TaxID=1735272 RepID=UPI001B88CAC9|nr:methionyl-tRNA formyltransferase, mitochondrial-like [Gigantopelta aegis]XP_041378641.1 methionyl-tRNA formyltransferase, mitochondrial-like [Gigantopelta aegis]
MLIFRPTSYFSSTSNPLLLKLIGKHKLGLQNTCDYFLHIRYNSLSCISLKNNSSCDKNVGSRNRQFDTVSKETVIAEKKPLGLKGDCSIFGTTELHVCHITDRNINMCTTDGGKKNCQNVNDNKNNHQFDGISERFVMQRSQNEHLRNIFYNKTESALDSRWKCNNSRWIKQCLEFQFCQNTHNKGCKSQLPWKPHHQHHNRTKNHLLCSQKRGCFCSLTCARTYSTKTISGQEKQWKILFFGTDDFAVEILRILNENKLSSTDSIVEALDVVSNPGKTAVRNYADTAGLPVFTWPVRSLANDYDIGVLASFGHLIPGQLISSFPHGILNVHPSLLPRWRGSAPIIHTILNGDEVTGISIMKLRPKRFDVGSLLVQKEVSVPPRVTSCQLSEMLARQGAQVLIDCLSNLASYENAEYEQPTDGVTLAHKLKASAAHIRWHQQTSVEIDRLYRAVGEIMPLKSHWKDSPVKLLDMVDPVLVQDMTNRLAVNAAPGTPVFSKDRQLLLIKCKDGYVGFRTVIIKKKMSAQAFYNGYLSKPQNKDIIFV